VANFYLIKKASPSKWNDEKVHDAFFAPSATESEALTSYLQVNYEWNKAQNIWKAICIKSAASISKNQPIGPRSLWGAKDNAKLLAHKEAARGHMLRALGGRGHLIRVALLRLSSRLSSPPAAHCCKVFNYHFFLFMTGRLLRGLLPQAATAATLSSS